ncbi:hypothetical protein [Hoeflea alexandrii]|uniref:hypothetical protein n=1 Tax=Hoeflea alexandrii TaxID=288436 RepID=UPI0022AF0993|nr:hypothetical protein [Hoeflea alexandrii]MCZ4288717.1 hypothetical protein [Hoeflea alexandrii]
MTIGISNNSAALAILRQSFAQDLSGQQQNATDRIIDIVSGKTAGSTATGTISKIAAKAQSLADAEKREAGGTVSSEMSRSYSGAVNQAVQSSMNRMYAEGEAAGMKLWEANLENGKAVAGILVNSINGYNNPPQMKEIPTREEFNNSALEGEKDRLSRGADPVDAKRITEINMSDEAYKRKIDYINGHNERVANRDPNLHVNNFYYFGGQFSYRFGVSPKLSFDDQGKAHMSAFEIKYASGQTMLRYDGETLTAYNEDGSVSK